MTARPVQFDGRYAGARVLVTGHTGFKGSWMAAWLARLGAHVTGLSLDPPAGPSHWALLSARLRGACDDRRGDVRDARALAAAFDAARPQIVFHLAAQPLVRLGYREPAATFDVNVMGTVQVLEAARAARSVRAVVVVTSDKCYAQQGGPAAFSESDRLGGHDPYSASKACAELVADSWRRSFLSDAASRPIGLATARAGNVIGGGDWGEDRLVPDLVRGALAARAVPIRHPQAVRPWQHVLEPLAGYLWLGARLLDGERAAAQAWNFGPREADHRCVAELAAAFAGHWPAARTIADTGAHPHEAAVLRLDASLAGTRLGWRPVWDFDAAVARTARWYAAWHERGELRTDDDLDAYVAAAAAAQARWTAQPEAA